MATKIFARKMRNLEISGMRKNVTGACHFFFFLNFDKTPFTTSSFHRKPRSTCFFERTEIQNFAKRVACSGNKYTYIY